MGKIISILVLIILLIALPVGLYLVSQKTQFFSKAGSDDVPRELQISNISDNSLTVSWITLKPVNGFISYGSSTSLASTIVDDRDQGTPQPRLTHHVTVKSLLPATKYYYKIGSGSTLLDDKGQPFSQTTAPTTVDAPPLADPMIGKVVNEGSIPTEGIVYIKSVRGTLLSTYLREGKWLITLNNARTLDLTQYLTLSGDDVLELSVKTGQQSTDLQAKMKDRESLSVINVGGASASSPVGSVHGYKNTLEYIKATKARKP